MKDYYIPPDKFYILGFEIRFYGLIMGVAMLIGVMLACHLAKKKGVKSDDIFMLALIALPCAIVGARLYYCFFYEYNYSFWELFNIRKGGLAIYGGVLGGIVGVIILAIIKRDFRLVAILFDICAPCLLLGQALGRWGNFFNQEAYGNLITDPNLQWFPYEVFIEGKEAWYQATFFYESLWNAVGVVVMLLVYYRTKSTGNTTATYFVWYGLGRSIIEGLRADSLYIGNTGIRVSQALSMVLVLVGLAIFVFNYLRKRQRNG